MLISGRISARLMCELCWWCSGFSQSPLVAKHAKKPGAPSGHYSRHLDQVFGYGQKTSTRYTIAVPRHQRHDLARTVHRIPTTVAHEALGAEMRSDPSLGLRLKEALNRGLLPPAYHTHPVVVANAGAPILPLALYCDGVPYSRTDSAIGYWVINLLSGVRHLLAVLRKKMTCKCGCRGWCSYDPVSRFLKWTLSCCAEGRFPQSRHDNEPWREEDS